MALRLARFNARIDLDDQPHKSAGFLTGVPAPVGAGLAFLPMILWLASDEAIFREPVVVALWLIAIAFLLISNIATLSWASIRPRRSVRLEVIALGGIIFAALLTEPWWTLVAICVALSGADALWHHQLWHGSSGSEQSGLRRQPRIDRSRVDDPQPDRADLDGPYRKAHMLVAMGQGAPQLIKCSQPASQRPCQHAKRGETGKCEQHGQCETHHVVAPTVSNPFEGLWKAVEKPWTELDNCLFCQWFQGSIAPLFLICS